MKDKRKVPSGRFGVEEGLNGREGTRRRSEGQDKVRNQTSRDGRTEKREMVHGTHSYSFPDLPSSVVR